MRALLLLLAPALLLACKDGPYSAPPGDFYCGSKTCEIRTQYCVLAPGADGGAQTATCAAAPEACAGDNPTCNCIPSTCVGACSVGDDGSVTVTCPD